MTTYKLVREGNFIKATCTNFNIYWFCAFVITFVSLVYRYPTLSYQSELYAEHGTNYLYWAIHGDFLSNILATDAGYLVLLPRVIAYAVYHLFPLYYFPYITNFIGLFFISFCTSFFASRSFREVVKSDLVRSFICILFGVLLIPFYINCTYINFSYHGIILCFLLLFYPLKNLSRCERLILSLFIAVLSLNKFHFVLFFPLYCIFTFYHYKKKSTKSLCFFFIPSILSFFIQIINILRIMHVDPMLVSRSSLPIEYYVKNIINSLLAYVQCFSPISQWWLAFFVLIFAVIVTFILWKNNKISNFQVIFLITLNYISLSFILITSLGHTLPEMQLTASNLLLINRYEFITIHFVLFFLLLLVYFLIGAQNSATSLVTQIFLMFMLVGGHLNLIQNQSSDYTREDYKIHSVSDWKQYYVLLEDEKYFVPINPMRPIKKKIWAISNGVDVSPYIKKIKNGVIEVNESRYIYGFIYDSKISSSVRVYDQKGSLIEEGKLITKKPRNRKLIKFNSPITGNLRLKFVPFDRNGIAKLENAPVRLLLITD